MPEKKIPTKNPEKFFQRKAFSQYVDSLQMCREKRWSCCNEKFENKDKIHVHVARHHKQDVQEKAELLSNSVRSKEDDCSSSAAKYSRLSPSQFHPFNCSCEEEDKKFTVVLFYHYVNITTESLNQLKLWQENVCTSANLTGKLKLAKEGINATLEGCTCAIDWYQTIILQHPIFMGMVPDDFKTSEGDGKSFSNLKISTCDEICTMGVDPDTVKPQEGGTHLTPKQFHDFLIKMKSGETSEEKDKKPLLLDCRNFYESKIGKFEGALAPDIRKFSYFPEYVKENASIFDNREVAMYCTGGIRCERASAYLKTFTGCSDVYQLKGGIHKYLEEYPDGLYHGKLFVFDNRFAIGDESKSPISKCCYCGASYDSYEVCSSKYCSQLVLICDDCRHLGKTSCCVICGENNLSDRKIEECSCTEARKRIPKEET